MAFQQFTFPQVIEELGLSVADMKLFDTLPAESVAPDFEQSIREGADLASAINTEKARSEFVIAPLLFVLWRRHRGQFCIFSGVELVADANRGLNGICDFLLARSASQHIMTLPILSIVEAKNENLRSGLGQCIASLVAANIVNASKSGSQTPVYGVVTSGSLWKFLKLVGSDLSIDGSEYHINQLGKLFAVLGSIVTSYRK